jgi:Holliday junction resolvase
MAYTIHRKTNLPLIENIRLKFEEMYIFGELEENCKKFGVSENLLRKLIYSDSKVTMTQLNFDTIIRLSNMFEIPYEEFIDYNAYVHHDKHKSREEIEEEEKMLKQYQVGKKWEEQVMDYYNDRNYFVYKIPTMNSGTVFDVIAVKKGAALMIECKHIDSDKLYYAGSGILKKRDELNHFVNKTGNNVYIYVESEKTGTWWTTWVRAYPIFEKKGYIDINDCFPCDLNNKEEKK